MVSKILERASHSSTAGYLATSVIATTMPGRIYAEARNYTQVQKLAQSYAELNPLKVSPVPQEDIFKILDFSPSHTDWPWAKVRGNRSKWRWYEGDMGLITRVEGRNKKCLALIPRINVEGQSRPPQALAVRRNMEIRRAARAELYGRFVCEGDMFSAEGLLLVDLDNIPILPLFKPLPSSAELAVFRSTSLLSAVEENKTSQHIAQARMKTGDRVKVVSGPYCGLIGEVQAMKEDEVAVYLPSQGVLEDMPKDTVRAAFAVGDQVKVLDGQSKGLVGWVTVVSAGNMLRVLKVNTLRVFNVEDPTEVDNLHF